MCRSDEFLGTGPGLPRLGAFMPRQCDLSKDTARGADSAAPVDQVSSPRCLGAALNGHGRHLVGFPLASRRPAYGVTGLVQMIAGNRAGAPTSPDWYSPNPIGCLSRIRPLDGNAGACPPRARNRCVTRKVLLLAIDATPTEQSAY